MLLRTLGAARDIDGAAWDACAGGDNPFVSHAFFVAMEESGTACAETGWLPQHLGVFRGDALVGVIPLYVKSHSVGEFVFDYGWANAYQRAGGRYYPKLQIAVPYTPVPGPRLLLRPDVPPSAELLEALAEVTEELRLSSLHITFCPHDLYALGGEAGWLQRTGLQFHWHNRGYATFQEFSQALSARKRKAVRVERSGVDKAGLELFAVSGGELREEHWDAFYSFYLDTCSRKWGEAALTREFFARLHHTMADKVVLMLARRQGRWIAGALNLRGREALFGRNWGCLEYHPYLHFELCYYRAIDYAIEHGLSRVEAGAQGIHKVARGYEPVTTYSLHYVRDPGFRRVLAQVLEQERAAISEDAQEIAAHTPFRRAEE